MSEARTLWEEGREPGHQVVALGSRARTHRGRRSRSPIGGEVGRFFDIAFVLVCVGVALLVRPQDFFTVGVLPPLVMLVVFTLVAVARPAALADRERLAHADLVSGLSTHAIPLGIGYGLCLVVLAVRDQYLRTH